MNGSTILLDMLGHWAKYGEVYSSFAKVEELTEQAGFTDAREHNRNTIAFWTAEQRLRMLNEHWDESFGGMENAPLEDVTRFNVPAADMMRLNLLVEIYNAPRAILHLYAHAHLFWELGNGGPLNDLKKYVVMLLTR